MLKSKVRSEQVFIETQKSDGLTVISWGSITPESALRPRGSWRDKRLGYLLTTRNQRRGGPLAPETNLPGRRDRGTPPKSPHRAWSRNSPEMGIVSALPYGLLSTQQLAVPV